MIIKQIILLLLYFKHLCKGQIVQSEKVQSRNTTISRVTGTLSEVGEFSYSVLFYEAQEDSSNKYVFRTLICSGNVLSTRWVLTTATPLGYYSLKMIHMFAGTVNEVSTKINPDALYYIDKIIIHPEWHEQQHNNLGLARTTKTITFGIGLGTVRIPLDFKFPSNNETMMCKMTLWGTNHLNHLMGRMQITIIRKQSIHFKVSNDPQMCPNYFIPNKTLCLFQFNESRIDVCSVNVGSAITCGFGIVAIFTGRNNYQGCTDLPPLDYSAVNLYGHIDWIQEMVDHSIVVENDAFPKISSSELVSLNFPLLMLGQLLLYFNVLN